MNSFSDCLLWYAEQPPPYCFGQTCENDDEERGRKSQNENLKFKPALLLGVAAMCVVAVTSSLAQELPEKLPTKEDLAKDNKLFAELATSTFIGMSRQIQFTLWGRFTLSVPAG
jgi:hypothetical protein